MIYPINPVAKPRMTQSDKWKKRPIVMKYRDFKDQCKLHKVVVPESGSQIVFFIPMPKSWSKAKKESYYNEPHQQRPDLDNLIKGLFDIYSEDSFIWNFYAEKIWSYHGAIRIKKPLF